MDTPLRLDTILTAPEKLAAILPLLFIANANTTSDGSEVLIRLDDESKLDGGRLTFMNALIAIFGLKNFTGIYTGTVNLG